MAELTIHRGSSQIGGCCTEISTGESRILIDFGANLPGTDETAQRKDSEMFQKVFGSRRDGAVLFAHTTATTMACSRRSPMTSPCTSVPWPGTFCGSLSPA